MLQCRKDTLCSHDGTNANTCLTATEGDKELATVITAVQHGQWPSRIDNALTPYYNRKNDLAVVDGCLTWGRRIIIPKAFWKQLLEELHSNHLGMSRMKSLARSYLWWPQSLFCVEWSSICLKLEGHSI